MKRLLFLITTSLVLSGCNIHLYEVSSASSIQRDGSVVNKKTFRQNLNPYSSNRMYMNYFDYWSMGGWRGGINHYYYNRGLIPRGPIIINNRPQSPLAPNRRGPARPKRDDDINRTPVGPPPPIPTRPNDRARDGRRDRCVPPSCSEARNNK
jgi:hypothetical protein